MGNVGEVLEDDTDPLQDAAPLTPELGAEWRAPFAALASENAALREQLDEARRGERYFRTLLEQSEVGIAVIDAQNNIQYLSPAVEAIEGYSIPELLGGNGKNNTHIDDLELVLETVRRTLENPGHPISVTWRRQHKDGRWLWLEGVAINLLQDPTVRGIVTYYRDVTARKRAEGA